MKKFIYHNQTVYHKPCFNLFIPLDNLFDNQGGKINKSDIFCTLRHIAFYENLRKYIYIYINCLPPL